MTTFSLYSYAWDIHEIGMDRFAGEVTDLGLNGVTLAGAYHGGKFLRPHGVQGRVYFPQDGVVYFKHRPDRYGLVEPVRWPGLEQFEPFAELEQNATHLRRTAWMVACNNARVGALHPELVSQNCFGDRYAQSLNPAHPDVRAYVVALCQDIAEQHDLQALVIETPGWLPFKQDFAMRPVDRWLAHGLGLCFAPASLAGANAAGIDAVGLRARLAKALEAHLQSGLALDDVRAAEWLQADFVDDPEWTAFHRWRQSVVTSLVAEIRAALPKTTQLRVIPSVSRPTAGAWREGSDLKALALAGDGLEICAYEPDAEAVGLDVFDVRRRIGVAPLSAVIRTGFPDLGSGGQAVEAARHLTAAGVDALNFYNYGHMDRPSLNRIKTVVEAVS